MRKAEIINGKVVNIIEVDPSNIPEWCAEWPDAESDAAIGHAWNGTTFHPPVLDIDRIAASVRAERNVLLQTHVDPIAGNVLIWQDLPAQKQQEVIDYRRSLLNIPQQVGFPLSVEWPTPPTI